MLDLFARDMVSHEKLSAIVNVAAEQDLASTKDWQTSREFERNSVLFNGIHVERVKRARDLQARFVRDWKSARDHRADIVFGPEMLGTMEMEARSGKYNSLLRNVHRRFRQYTGKREGNPLDN